MAPPSIRRAVAPAADSTPPPPLPEKKQIKRPGTAVSTRTLSSSSIPTLSTTRLHRQLSTSSSSAATLQQQTLSARKPVRSVMYPPSSRSAIPVAALDPSQDHYRSDSGRSTGSSRSTATTDSFFLPQHPHAPNRRLKNLPAPPSNSTLTDGARPAQHVDSPSLAQGLNIVIEPCAGSIPPPPSHLVRSKSSVSTTPTSPEEGDASPLEPPVPCKHHTSNGDEPNRVGALRLDSGKDLDDFWKSNYSYARPSADLKEHLLPPLMRSNAPIPPSRSQSLDPLAAPLDLQEDEPTAYSFPRDYLLEVERGSQTTGSATPLVAANLDKLNLQHLGDNAVIATKSAAASSSPLASLDRAAQTPTKRSVGHNRLAVPCTSPYEQPTASASSSSSAVDRRSHLNKSSSSLSTSSAHEGDKAALTTASKRSSISSSSSFRRTLSRQAKTLRNSFMKSPPLTGKFLSTSQEHVSTTPAASSPQTSPVPISHDPSPSLAGNVQQAKSIELSPPRRPLDIEGGCPVASGRTETRQKRSNKQGATSASLPESLVKSGSSRSKMTSMRSEQKSDETASKRSGSINKSDPRFAIPASKSNIPQSPPQPPTDYSKLEERPRSRLSSRLRLQNTNWSMKISKLKEKKPDEATASKPLAECPTLEAASRAAVRRSKSTAGITAASSASGSKGAPDSANSSSMVHALTKPGVLVSPPSSLLTSDRTSADAQISPSFAETFAFLDSHIDRPRLSPPPTTASIPLLDDVEGTPAAQATRMGAAPASPVDTLRQPTQPPRTLSTDTEKGLPKDNPELNSQQVVSQQGSREDERFEDSLFDRLAESPEAVYKTLAFPAPDVLPTSQSLDNIAPKSDPSDSQRFGHKKHTSLGSATMIFKPAHKAAANLDKQASGSPVASSARLYGNAPLSTKSSLTSVLPVFTPVDEESRFFDALTSPLNEQLPVSSNASPSPDDSNLPAFATASDFFSCTGTEPASPMLDRLPMSNSAASVTAAMTHRKRMSIGRRFSGVLDPSKMRPERNDLPPIQPQNPRSDPACADALPSRSETSLGFYLRNPLRRERKTSQSILTQAASQQDKISTGNATSTPESTVSPMKAISPTSTLRRVSTNFGLDRTSPPASKLTRPGTSLGLAASTPGRSKTDGAFSSSVMAPTKSSLARSVQPSPPSTKRYTVRSTSASSHTTPPSRSPQRLSSPPSSFRGGVTSAVRPRVFATGSHPTSSSASTTAVAAKASPVSAKPPLPSTDDATRSALVGASQPRQETSFRTSATSVALFETLDSSSDAASLTPSEVRRRRTLSKPVLRPIRTSFAEEGHASRPSSVMGFRRGTAGQGRKMSQPTLDMVDDREFLEALEQVREMHRERIQAQAQEAENKTRLARLGMMSGNYLKTKVSGPTFDEEGRTQQGVYNGESGAEKGQAETQLAEKTEGVSSVHSKFSVGARPRLRHKRSASADAMLYHSRSTSSASQGSEKDIDKRQKDIVRAYTDKKAPVGLPTTGLEWGVGKASGKLHDGTFVNDDDWKKEVKALFLIRELVQTERSYARHLGSLFSVVRKMQMGPLNGSTNAPGVKRKSASNLFAAYSSAYGSKSASSTTPPSHIALLRTYLPQLIMLSNALVQRVEENPTSAGVGAAFDVLSAQLESTFVGWSAVASQALADLRFTEQAKGKSPYKIGLVPLTRRDSTEVGAWTTDASGSSGSSSPGSGFFHSTLRMTSLTRPPSPMGVRQEHDASSRSDAPGGTLPVKRSTKRRSTITSTSFIVPRVVVAPAPVFTASPEHERGSEGVLNGSDSAAKVESARASTTPTRRFGHSRSQSTLVTPMTTPTSSIGPEPWSALSMTSSATSASTQAPPSGLATKCLTPMDIAIMPTQRIPRYGLMLRDLLRNTPPESLSHARVQRAIALIQKLALMCDSVAPVSLAPASGTAAPSRASSILGLPSVEPLSMQVSPLQPSPTVPLVKRS